MTVANPGQTSSGGKSTTILVLGILSVVCCQILGPVAWYMGSQQLKAIQQGLAPASEESNTKVGMILGIVGTVILGLSVLWIFFAGGMAVLSGLANR